MKDSIVEKNMKFVPHGTLEVLKKKRSKKLDCASQGGLCKIATFKKPRDMGTVIEIF